MSRKNTIRTIHKVLSDMRQDDVLFPKVMVEAQQPAAETDPDYAVNNYPRLLQLVRAGLVPDEMISKMTNILKDPKRFGVSPKVRDELYTIMIKTLNYIVVSDPAAWARFRQYLLNTQVESTQMKSDIFSKFKKALHEESKKLNVLGKSGNVRRLSEERLMEAARHQSGDNWLASTGESWGGKNADGITRYFPVNMPNAEQIAKSYATGKISEVDAKKITTKIDKTKEGSIHKGKGDKSVNKTITAVDTKLATKKALDGPETKEQAIGTNPKAEKALATRMFKIAEVVLQHEKDNKARKAEGKEPLPDPKFDLCTVSVPGTNLFCGESLQIARKKMPQLKTKVTAGSPAEALLKQQYEKKGKPYDPNGEVDAEGAFLEHLASKGIKFDKEQTMNSTEMKATQNELVGAKVVSMATAIARPDDAGIPKENQAKVKAILTAPLIVSKDGYVLDGHHRWAAVALNDLMQGNGENPTKLNVIQVDMNIEDLVEESNSWGNDFGLERKSSKEQTKKESTEPKHNVIAESLLNSIRGFVSEEVNKIRLSIDKN